MTGTSQRNAAKSSISITLAFDEFRAEFIEVLDEGARQRYMLIIDLFTQCLNEYGYQDLNFEDSEIFEAAQLAESENRKFVDLFGPDKLTTSLSTFLEWHVVRHIATDENIAHAAGTVILNLFRWLGEKNYIDEKDTQTGMKIGAETSGNLPDAERALRLIIDFVAEQIEKDGKPAPDSEGPDHFSIRKVDAKEITIEPHLRRGHNFSITLPTKATKLIQANWEISGRIGHFGGERRFIEVANVFPL